VVRGGSSDRGDG